MFWFLDFIREWEGTESIMILCGGKRSIFELHISKSMNYSTICSINYKACKTAWIQIFICFNAKFKKCQINKQNIVLLGFKNPSPQLACIPGNQAHVLPIRRLLIWKWISQYYKTVSPLLIMQKQNIQTQFFLLNRLIYLRKVLLENHT